MPGKGPQKYPVINQMKSREITINKPKSTYLPVFLMMTEHMDV